MPIDKITFGSKKLTPLKGYTRPLMQLSLHDKALIWQHEKLIHNWEQQLSALQKEIGLPGQTKYDIIELEKQIKSLIKNINETLSKIRQIKETSYTNQLNHIDTTV